MILGLMASIVQLKGGQLASATFQGPEHLC